MSAPPSRQNGLEAGQKRHRSGTHAEEQRQVTGV